MAIQLYIRGFFLSLFLIGFGLYSRPVFSQVDSTQIREVALKYLDAFYLAKPEYLVETVHPNLFKCTVQNFNRKVEILNIASREEMIVLAKDFNVTGSYGENSQAEVFILDCTEQYASVKLVAEGWVDYMLLARLNGKWKIVSVLWYLIKSN